MKNFTPFKKLLKGIVLFSLFYLLFSIFGDNKIDIYENKATTMFLQYTNKELASIITNGLVVIISVFMVYCFISGLYRICTFPVYVREFEDKTPGGIPVKGNTSYPNINRILSYRESKMAGMSPDNAADLYVASSKLESLYTGYQDGSESMRVLSYIESKLSGMSPDRGLSYLANKL